MAKFVTQNCRKTLYLIILKTVQDLRWSKKNDEKMKNNMNRLDRFKNRIEPGKKVTDS